MWRENIDLTLATVDLTSTQAEYLRGFSGRVEDLVGGGPTEQLTAEWEAAKGILGVEIAMQALVHLGGAASDGEACSCNKEIDDCPSGYSCATDGDGCDVIDNDCGLVKEDMCDGECLSPG